MRTATRWCLSAAAAFLVAATAWAEVSVTNVTVQQRYPWNGLVDIDYEVVCDDPDADVWVTPMGWDGDLNEGVNMLLLSGEGVEDPVKAGTHRMTWDMGTEYTNFHCSAFSVKMSAVSGAASYMVIDMSGGTGAESWPISYLASPPGGEWADEYKTTKLVLRLILPGTFTMGSPGVETGRNSNEQQHQVTLTKPYYLGVFEVTQKQWTLAMGSNPSYYKGDMRPVEYVSYNNIRGGNVGSKWPNDPQVDATSFMGVLRAKTGLSFDLPTEAQWEYACRAETTTALNSGKNLTATESCANMAEVGRYTYNQSDYKGGYGSNHTKVGCYMPNAWGLYDMHGNVCEFCKDWYADNYGGTGTMTDPLGPAGGSARVHCGGSWGDAAMYCRSARRGNRNPSSTGSYYGFRLFCPMSE